MSFFTLEIPTALNPLKLIMNLKIDWNCPKIVNNFIFADLMTKCGPLHKHCKNTSLVSAQWKRPKITAVGSCHCLCATWLQALHHYSLPTFDYQDNISSGKKLSSIIQLSLINKLSARRRQGLSDQIWSSNYKNWLAMSLTGQVSWAIW